MVRRRENTQQSLKRHAVTTVLVCAAAAGAIRMRAAIAIALAGKEAAP